MMTFYAAAGSYQIRSEDGKNMPYIMRLGKLQPVSIPEFSLWSMLLWDVLTYEELRKKFYDKMEETEIEPSSFDKSLEMLVKRKLIIKGVGYTGADALYKMLNRKLSAEKRKERNHRIFLFGGFMESIVPELKTMTEDEGKDFLYHIAKSTEAQEYLKKRAEGVGAG